MFLDAKVLSSAVHRFKHMKMDISSALMALGFDLLKGLVHRSSFHTSYKIQYTKRG